MRLATRIAKLEMAIAPKRGKLWVVRYEGPGSEHMRQPTEEELTNATKVYSVRFLAKAKDGFPAAA